MARRKWQLWLHGSTLIGHCDDCTKKEALNELREQAKKEYGYRRLPKGSMVSQIGGDYYREIAESNKRQGFGLRTGD